MAIFEHYANENSLTRDELANERSFLAYIRCGSTLLISGVALHQASLHFLIKSESNAAVLFHKALRPVSSIICVVATLLVISAIYRMRSNGKLLAKFALLKPTIWGAMVLVAILLCVDIILLKHCVTFGRSGYASV